VFTEGNSKFTKELNQLLEHKRNKPSITTPTLRTVNTIIIKTEVLREVHKKKGQNKLNKVVIKAADQPFKSHKELC
jgi:hypothetical protein